MKLNTRDFLRKCQFPLLLLCGSLPIPLAILLMLAPEGLPHLWPLSLMYLALALLCLVIPGKWRVALGAAGAAALLALGVMLLPLGVHPLTILCAVLYAALLLYGLPMGGWDREQEPHPTVLGLGVAAHIVGQVLVNIDRFNGATPPYQAAEPVLIAGFLGFGLLAMLSANRSSMGDAAMHRQQVPGSMRRMNVLLTLALLALTLLVSLIPQVLQLLEAAWDGLIASIVALAVWFASLLRSGSSSGNAGEGPAAESAGAGMPAEDPSLFAQVLEKIIIVVVAVVVAVGVIWALRFLYKRLKRLLSFLWARITRFAAVASEDYEDEITDTREEGETGRVRVLDTLRRRLTPVDESKLTPAERIRYRYRRLISRRADWQPSHTARETLPGEAAALYERARYSHHPVSARDADDFARQIK